MPQKKKISKVKLVKDDDCVGDDYFVVTYTDGKRKEYTASILPEHSKTYLNSFCCQTNS